jgi:hypothetical protein
MIGSLIVSFPTARPCKGGNMLLRHLQNEHLVDFEKLHDHPLLPVAYAAYFCDVERTVSPITSGHRIILKYNLYLRDPSLRTFPDSRTTWNELAFQEKLSKLLSDPSFLPTGGKLGFCLSNHYPISVHQKEEGWKKVSVYSVLPPLRGIDHIVERVCGEFSLRVTPCIVYNTSRALMMSDKVYTHEFTEYDDKILLQDGHDVLKEWSDRLSTEEDVQWVFEMRSFGNEYVNWVTGGLCLSVQVGPAEKRATV